MLALAANAFGAERAPHEVMQVIIVTRTDAMPAMTTLRLPMHSPGMGLMIGN
jgi:hypothetical protein